MLLPDPDQSRPLPASAPPREPSLRLDSRRRGWRVAKMGEGMRAFLNLLAAAALALPCAASSQSYQPPRHGGGPSPLIVGGGTAPELSARADAGTQIERDRAPADELAEHRQLDRALAALARSGRARSTPMSSRSRSTAIRCSDARRAPPPTCSSAATTPPAAPSSSPAATAAAPSALPRGSPGTLAIALARIAELMDRERGRPDPLHDQPRHAVRPLLSTTPTTVSARSRPPGWRAMLDELGLAQPPAHPQRLLFGRVRAGAALADHRDRHRRLGRADLVRLRRRQ